jgi:hypothetical protein
VLLSSTVLGRDRSVRCLWIVGVSLVFVRRVKSFSCLSPYALRSFSQRAQVRFLFSYSIESLAINLPSPAVHVIRIHGIYDKNRSVLYGMSALLALQVVVTAISSAFYRCGLITSSLVSVLFLMPWKLFRWRMGRGASLGRSIIGLVSIGYRPHSSTQPRYDNMITSLRATTVIDILISDSLLWLQTAPFNRFL